MNSPKFIKKPWDVLDEEILPRLSVSAIFDDLSQLKQSGRQWTACCPFHDDAHPSFSISDDPPFKWICFAGCGSGVAISFLRKKYGYSWMDAAAELARRAAIDPKVLETWREAWTEEHWAEYEAQNRKEKLLEDFIDLSAKIIISPEGKRGIEYLASRSLTAASREGFEIGFYPSTIWAKQELLKIGYTLDDIKSANLLSEEWSNRVVGPWRDRSGRIINIWGRTVIDAERKFNYLTGGKRGSPFCLDKVQGNEVIVVEGFFDAIHAHGQGIDRVVAVGGSVVTENQARALRDAKIRSVTLNLDWDESGEEGTWKSIDVLHAAGLRVYVVDPSLKERFNDK